VSWLEKKEVVRALSFISKVSAFNLLTSNTLLDIGNYEHMSGMNVWSLSRVKHCSSCSSYIIYTHCTHDHACRLITRVFYLDNKKQSTKTVSIIIVQYSHSYRETITQKIIHFSCSIHLRGHLRDCLSSSPLTPSPQRFPARHINTSNLCTRTCLQFPLYATQIPPLSLSSWTYTKISINGPPSPNNKFNFRVIISFLNTLHNHHAQPPEQKPQQADESMFKRAEWWWLRSQLEARQ